MMSAQTRYKLQKWISALPSERYDVRAVWPDRAAKIPAIMRTVSKAGLLALLPLMMARNAAGFGIVGRPTDPRFIFVDDISEATLNAMVKVGHRPAVVVESSPGNFQSFHDAGPGVDHAVAKVLAREMAYKWGGDPGSADAFHAGRIPGFTNRKPKHERPDGSYPFARLRTATQRIDLVLAARAADVRHLTTLPARTELKDQQGARGGALGNCAPSGAPTGDHSALYGRLLAPYIARYGAAIDRSRADYSIAKWLLVKGMPEAEVRLVLAASGKSQERHNPGPYIETTLNAAQGALEQLGEHHEH